MATAAAAAVEAVEAGDGQVLERNGAQRRKAGQGWKCMPFIIGTVAFESVGSIGVAANLTVYLVKRFNMGQLTAANISNIFYGDAGVDFICISSSSQTTRLQSNYPVWRALQ
ncbi:hypothetical protein ACQ4PT_000330 [Festuca glaucescens]